jgi:hypothetical protein
VRRLCLGWIVLPARFATCPPAALSVVFLRLVDFAASSFTSAKRTGSVILRAKEHSPIKTFRLSGTSKNCLVNSQPSTLRMYRSEVKGGAAGGGHERRCMRCGDGGHSDSNRTQSQSTRLNQSTESDAEITANIAASNASKPEISVSLVSVEIREESFSYTFVKSAALPA